MAEVDGATLVARSLKQQGINHLFGVDGKPDDAKEVVYALLFEAPRDQRGAVDFSHAFPPI